MARKHTQEFSSQITNFSGGRRRGEEALSFQKQSKFKPTYNIDIKNAFTIDKVFSLKLWTQSIFYSSLKCRSDWQEIYKLQPYYFSTTTKWVRWFCCDGKLQHRHQGQLLLRNMWRAHVCLLWTTADLIKSTHWAQRQYLQARITLICTQGYILFL